MVDPVPPGTTGRVVLVDDTGTVFVDWDNGRKLGEVEVVVYLAPTEPGLTGFRQPWNVDCSRCFAPGGASPALGISTHTVACGWTKEGADELAEEHRRDVHDREKVIG